MKRKLNNSHRVSVNCLSKKNNFLIKYKIQKNKFLVQRKILINQKNNIKINKKKV